jgi:hypothetical protein
VEVSILTAIMFGFLAEPFVGEQREVNEAQKVAEIFLDYLNAQESACVSTRRQIGELFNVAEPTQQKTVSEQTFNLKFEDQQGAKIGSYAVAYEKNNIPEKFNTARNILQQSNATINSRYYGPEYNYTYWLYGSGKIYQQKRAHT